MPELPFAATTTIAETGTVVFETAAVTGYYRLTAEGAQGGTAWLPAASSKSLWVRAAPTGRTI